MRALTTLCVYSCLSLLTLSCTDGGNTDAPSGWRKLAPLARGPRQEHAVVALADKVYVIAGLDGPSNIGRVEVYDPQKDTWSEAAPVPMALNHPNAAALGGKIYVLGGMVGDFPWTAVGNAFEYDPSTDTWKELAPMPAGTERGSAAISASGTTIYLAGGLRSLAATFQEVDRR